MNEIINRLRDATRAVGETMDEVPAFEPDTRTSTRRSRLQARPWLVPVAAAASVTIAVAGGAAIARHGGGKMNVAAATTAGPASAPSFFAQADAHGVTIRSVSDGKVTARVDPPAEGEYVAIQAAQDNRLFYAASQTTDCRPQLYQLRLRDDGTVDSWGVLSFRPPEGSVVTSLAVNGDGSKIAYSFGPCASKDGEASLVVTDTGTGESRTWTTSSAGIVDLSMSADGRNVLFRRIPRAPSPPPVDAAPKPASPGAPSMPPVPPKVESSALPEELVTPALGKGGPLPEKAPASPLPPDSATAEPLPPVTVTLTAVASPPPTPVGQVGSNVTVSPSSAPGDGVPATKPVPVDPSAAPSDGVPPTKSGIVPPTAAPTATVRVDPTTGAVVKPEATVAQGAAACGVVIARNGTAPEQTASPVPSPVKVWVCTDKVVALLDTTTATGDDLDQAARPVDLNPSSGEGTPGPLSAVAISPDGTRILALQTSIRVDVSTPRVKQPGFSEVVAYDVSTGRAAEVLYKGADTESSYALDLDGTGENLLLTRPDEVGAVNGSQYRTLTREDLAAPASHAW
ncbi:hypothetical protein GCM10009530_75000 [Microbispora corallina]|uniref:WD40 repeat protein n=1 Tax=Microbispora corallina TaxID=83302 RepID=A0ABQ4GBC9_9ACTN|nr:hypothetical protein [Microbispora corallina]GIH44399.1 hypothetical protein Mco01_73990 [Microbispora corallina]